MKNAPIAVQGFVLSSEMTHTTWGKGIYITQPQNWRGPGTRQAFSVSAVGTGYRGFRLVRIWEGQCKMN